jgi:hypothetical protein
MMRKLFVSVALTATVAVASAPVADAHTLRYGRAKAVAENAMLRFVRSHESDLGYATFSPPLSSKRVSRHMWVFKFDFRFDGDATTEGECKVSVQYKNAYAQSTRARIYAIQVA